MLYRKPTYQEQGLIEFLIQKALISVPEQWEKPIASVPTHWKETMLVSPMNDGGMGSLLLFPCGKTSQERRMGGQVSEVMFKDQDGVDVLASLNIDQNGDFYELDVWKTDFSELIQIPESFPPITEI